MRNPSTGNAAPPAKPGGDANTPDPRPPGDGGGDPRATTRASVDGESAPRAPHERDESSDSGTGAPSELMQQAHDDVVAGKTGTDKGEATDAVYRRSLRSRTPGAERD